jgi:hypothetical protein
MRDDMLYYEMIDYCRNWHVINFGDCERDFEYLINKRINRVTYEEVKSNIGVQQLWKTICTDGIDEKEFIEDMLIGAYFIHKNIGVSDANESLRFVDLYNGRHNTMNSIVEHNLLCEYADTCIDILLNIILNKGTIAKVQFIRAAEAGKSNTIHIEKNTYIHDATIFCQECINTDKLNGELKAYYRHIASLGKDVYKHEKYVAAYLREFIKQIVDIDVGVVNITNMIDIFRDELINLGLKENNYNYVRSQLICHYYNYDAVEDYDNLDISNLWWLDRLLKNKGILKQG